MGSKKPSVSRRGRKNTETVAGKTKPRPKPHRSTSGSKQRKTVPRTEERTDHAAELESAQSALVRERDLLQAVMDGPKNMHLVYLDRDFNFVRVNQAYAATCGYRPEEMIGKNHFALYPHAENEAIFARVRDTEEPFEVRDKPFEFPDQPERGVTYWDWTLTPVKDQTGKVQGLIFALQETTARKKAEDALRESGAKYRSLFDNMTNGFALHDIVRNDRGLPVDYIFREVNSAFERLTGLKAADIVGKRVTDVLPGIKNDPADWIGTYGRIALSGGEAHFENYAAQLNKWYSVTAYSPVKGTFATIFEDITKRKKAEQALRQSEEQFRSAIEEAPIPVIMHAEDGEVLQISRTWTELTGYSIEDIRTFDEWTTHAVYGEGADKVRDHLKAIFASSSSSRVEFVVRTKTGDVLYWSFSASVPGQLSDGRRFVVGMALDITDRKQAEDALRKLNEELEQRVTQRTRFYSVLAGINETIMRERDRQALFAEACRIIVETGGFRLAWVGLVDPVSREVRQAASFGATAYLHGLRVIAADVPEGRGPTGRAIVEMRPVINLDFETNGHMVPWRERARKNGIRSSSAFPLRQGSDVIGAVTIYSDQPHFFTQEETSLLVTLSDNLSFALVTIATEQERRAMEENLRASYTEVQDLYNNAPCGYHSIDKNGVIVRINDTELGWLGYKRDDVVGKKYIYDFYTPRSVRRFQETFPQFVQSGSIANLDFELVRRDGTVMQVLLSGTAVRDRNGKFLMSRSTLFDITELKAAERRERAANELLGLFARKMARQEYLDSACKVISEWSGCRNVGIRLEDQAGGLSFVSHVGHDAAFLKEESILSRERDQCICTRVVAGSPGPGDLAFMTPGGSFVSGNTTECMNTIPAGRSAEYRGTCMRAGYRSLAVIPIRYADRKIGVLHLADKRENIVSRGDTEFLEQMAGLLGEAVYRFGIEEERMRLATALESAADAVVITEPEHGLIQYVNPAFEQITGYAHDEVEGKTLHLLDSDRHDEPFYLAMREAMLRDGRWQGRLVSRKKDGTQYFEDCTVSAVRGPDGKPVNYVSIRRDVTERLRLESVAEAVNSMDSIGYVFAGLRHEIGNPVNSAKSILSVLEQKLDTAPPDRVRDYIRRAMVEVGRVEKLLHLFKTFSLFETPDIADLNTSAVVDEFFRFIRTDFSARGISLGRKIGPGAERLRADQRALQQVLLNVVANAADALEGRPNPHIQISAARDADEVLLSVRDNGKGMTEEQQRNLFRPFYTSKAKGTGLGLVIVRKLVSRMGGKIEIESTVGEGTTVHIHLQAVTHG